MYVDFPIPFIPVESRNIARVPTAQALLAFALRGAFQNPTNPRNTLMGPLRSIRLRSWGDLEKRDSLTCITAASTYVPSQIYRHFCTSHPHTCTRTCTHAHKYLSIPQHWVERNQYSDRVTENRTTRIMIERLKLRWLARRGWAWVGWEGPPSTSRRQWHMEERETKRCNQ